MRITTSVKPSAPRPAIWPPEGVEVPDERPQLRGALLLYQFPSAFWFREAATIMQHVDAFTRYSRFPIQRLNTDEPLPARVARLDFELVIVHYSVVSGAGAYFMTEDHLRWLKTSRAHKVLFCQDEFHHCGHRFWFCDEVGVDTLYTLLEPSEFDKVYGSRTRVPRIRTNLPGYVSDQVVADGESLYLPDERRPVDIGYRARRLPAYCGRGGEEKVRIGERVLEEGAGTDLVLDIESGAENRLFGKDWSRFLARCKAVLGVESGVSVFDLDDRVMEQYRRLAERGVEPTVDELTEAAPLEDRVFYRTISPRHFEAAATRTCQILFEGRYSGVMEPMVHYIPLRKDFSNLDEVLGLFRDPELRRELTDNAHRDLIASGRYSYQRFIEDFDRDLIEAGLQPEASSAETAPIRTAINRGRRWRAFKVQLRWIAGTVRYLVHVPYWLAGFARAMMRKLARSDSSPSARGGP